MKHIKKIGELFILDWRRVLKNPIALFLIISLMVIPSLYAWFNIKALWDPYANTSQLPIAVYSDDKKSSFQDKTINIGDEVIKNLKTNKQLGWKFVDSKHELDEGVKSGKYYAGVYLPADFSKNLLSFTNGEINKPKIVYSINEKINAIAPKITAKGASSLQEQISETFIKTASTSLLKVFNNLGYDIDKNMVSIEKLKTTILSANDNMGNIDKYSQEVVNLHEKMPELKSKLDKANEFITYLPEVDAMGNKIISLNDKMPEIKKGLSGIVTLQEKIPEIKSAGKQLAMIDSDFSNIEKTMNEGIQEAKNGLEIIQKVQASLPEIEKLGNQANEFADVTLSASQKLQEALPNITDSVGVTLQSIQDFLKMSISATSTIEQAIADNKLTDEEKAQLDQLVKKTTDNIAQQEEALKNLVDFMTKIQQNAGNNALQDKINQLNQVIKSLGAFSTKLNQINTAIQSGDISKVQAYLAELKVIQTNISKLIDQIDVNGISSTINETLNKLISTITTAKGLLNKAQQIDFEALFKSTSKTLASAIDFLEKYQKEMPAIKQEIHDANVMLNGNMDKIVSAINKAVSLYQNDLPTIEEKVGKAAQFFKNDYPSVRKDLTKTLNTVNEKTPDLEKAINQANDLIINDLPSIKAGIKKAAEAIRKGEKEVDLGELVKLLKLDATKESDFLAQPVEIQENRVYPISNNGSASTPFYTVLCLWVGALLFSNLATTDVYLKDKDKNRYSPREQFFGRMLTFIVVGLAQALVVTLGNYFILGVDVANPVYSVLFALLIAWAFMIMVYVFISLFGNIGKGIAIIILVLSISGGGGNYPIQVSGKFFQLINPFLPFTHAVNLLRESAGGIYWTSAWTAIIFLVLVSLAFVILGAIFFPHMIEKKKVIAEKEQQSHLFH